MKECAESWVGAGETVSGEEDQELNQCVKTGFNEER
jgi:hypothetical protein